MIFFLLLVAPIWHLASDASAQNNTLPQTVSDPAVADDLDYLFQKIVTINGVSSSGTISNLPFWTGINGNIWNTNSGNVQIGPLGQPQNPQYQLDVNGNLNTNATLSASTAVFGTGSKISTFTNLGSLLMSPASSVTYTSGLYISTLNALVPRMYFDQGGNIAVNSSGTQSGIPFLVQGQIRDTYDPVTNSGGQEVMVSKSGKLWDWTAGYGTGTNQNAFVMNESGILTTMICLPSGGSAPLCGINNNNITAHNPAYAWDVQGDINASGVYRDGTTAGISRTCTANQVPNADTTLGGIVTGGTCDAVRDNQVILTTGAIISGKFGDNRVAISTSGVTSGKFGDDKVLISTKAMVNVDYSTGNINIYLSKFDNTNGLLSPSSIYDNGTGLVTTDTFSITANSFSVGGSSLIVSGGITTISTLTVNQQTNFLSSVTIQSSLGLNVSQGSVTASSFFGDGSHLTGVTANAGGSTGQLQYNNNPNLGGASNLIYSNNVLTVLSGSSVTINDKFQVGSSTLIVTNGNVGVGNSNLNPPRGQGLIVSNLTGGDSIIVSSATGPNSNAVITLYPTGIGSAFVTSYALKPLSFGVGSSVQQDMTIDITHDIGIFTTSPGTGLDISTSARVSGDFIVGGDTTSMAGAWIAYTPAFGGYSVVPSCAACRYIRIGKTVIIRMYTSAGTSNSTSMTISLPFPSNSDGQNAAIAGCQDNGSDLTTPGRCDLANASSILTCYKDLNGASWTNSGGKRCDFTLTYESQ